MVLRRDVPGTQGRTGEGALRWAEHSQSVSVVDPTIAVIGIASGDRAVVGASSVHGGERVRGFGQDGCDCEWGHGAEVLVMLD